MQRYLLEIIKKLHYWLMEDLKNSHPIRCFNIILIGVNGFLVSDLIMPNMLNIFGVNLEESIAIIIAISSILLGVIKWGVVGIFETIKGKKFEIPVRYEFIGWFLSMPLLIFINKIFILIKAVSKKYDRKIEVNY